MEQPGWLSEAWAHLFVREQAGAHHNPAIQDFFRDAGHAGISRDEVPWCAAFVGACLSRSGVEPTGSLLARSYMAWGRALDAGRFGAIAVFRRGSNPKAGHVGFLIGETRDDLIILGGNQSDAVTVARYPRSRLLGLRWPAASATIIDQSTAANNALFEQALAHVLEMEGGYTDDPYDPGGPTNQGITLETFARHAAQSLTATSRARLVRDLKAISPAVVREIYDKRYWQPSRAAALPPPLALMHFDAAVNHGVSGAARMLQQALEVGVDGVIGPVTLAAANRRNPASTVVRYAEIRRARYRSLPHFWRFGRGWLNRVARTEKRSATIARTAPTPVPGHAAHPPQDHHEKGPAMSTHENQPTHSKWWGSSMTIWGALITAVSTVIPTLAPAFGLDITPDLVREAGEQLVNATQAIGGLFGIVMTIYGRSRASTRLVRQDMKLKL